ncbi:hypothetical protein [Nocardia vaccinii]|uniref:hypothetical protein n=1 Tax=Nocardia vaccinii TaxID=1822 RepID=UPI0012F492DA|nr:hypothetical protein [Nocardia vaccinii]
MRFASRQVPPEGLSDSVDVQVEAGTGGSLCALDSFSEELIEFRDPHRLGGGWQSA